MGTRMYVRSYTFNVSRRFGMKLIWHAVVACALVPVTRRGTPEMQHGLFDTLHSFWGVAPTDHL